MSFSKLTSQELQKLAKLSGFEVSADEALKFQDQLEVILDCIREIEKVPFSETVNNNKAINVFREDKVKPCESLDILKNAQQVEKSFFVVPKILKDHA